MAKKRLKSTLIAEVALSKVAEKDNLFSLAFGFLQIRLSFAYRF